MKNIMNSRVLKYRSLASRRSQLLIRAIGFKKARFKRIVREHKEIVVSVYQELNSPSAFDFEFEFESED